MEQNIVFFFFSSRRRHTRWNCDWSSDVCSSDLLTPIAPLATSRKPGVTFVTLAIRWQLHRLRGTFTRRCWHCIPTGLIQVPSGRLQTPQNDNLPTFRCGCLEFLAACQRANWKLGGPRGATGRLGLKRATLVYKMKRFGIARPADPWQD